MNEELNVLWQKLSKEPVTRLFSRQKKELYKPDCLFISKGLILIEKHRSWHSTDRGILHDSLHRNHERNLQLPSNSIYDSLYLDAIVWKQRTHNVHWKARDNGPRTSSLSPHLISTIRSIVDYSIIAVQYRSTSKPRVKYAYDGIRNSLLPVRHRIATMDITQVFRSLSQIMMVLQRTRYSPPNVEESRILAQSYESAAHLINHRPVHWFSLL